MRVPGRVLRRNVVLRDDGEGLGLHPRGQAGRRGDSGQWEDSGTTGGRRDDGRTADNGRTAGRWEDGGTTEGWRTTGDNTSATLGAHWGLGDAEEREKDVVG